MIGIFLFASLHLCIPSLVMAADIPKKIHYVWVGSNIPCEYIEEAIQTKILNPDYEMYIWTDAPSQFDRLFKLGTIINSVESIQLSPFQREVVRAEMGEGRLPNTKPNYAAVSDVYRIWILDEHGGVYLDFDTKSKAALGTLEAPFGFFWLSEYKNGKYEQNNTVIASVSGNIILKIIKNEIENRYQEAIHAANDGKIAHFMIILDRNAVVLDDLKFASLEEFWLAKLSGDSPDWNPQSGFSVDKIMYARYILTIAMSGPSVILWSLLKYIQMLDDETIKILLTNPDAQIMLSSRNQEVNMQKVEVTPTDFASDLKLISAMLGSHGIHKINYIRGFDFPSGKIEHTNDLSWLSSQKREQRERDKDEFNDFGERVDIEFKRTLVNKFPYLRQNQEALNLARKLCQERINKKLSYDLYIKYCEGKNCDTLDYYARAIAEEIINNNEGAENFEIRKCHIENGFRKAKISM
jgi:hypothetical protein